MYQQDEAFVSMFFSSKPLGVSGLRAVLMALGVLCIALGLVMGTQGWSCCEDFGSENPMIHEIIWHLRFPRSLGAWLSGALLGLAGMLAQGLFRNPLADPFLLGSASGASLGVSVALWIGLMTQLGPDVSLASSSHWLHVLWDALAFLTQSVSALIRSLWSEEAMDLVSNLGVTSVAFMGATLAVVLTLSLAKGVLHTQRLLLSGVVVGVILGAVNNLILQRHPSLLGALQSFMLGNVANVDEQGCWLMALVLALSWALAWVYSSLLDGLSLGEQTAKSLGFGMGLERWMLIAVLSLATATSVAQTGLIAFVGLAAPHLVRQMVKAPYKAWLELSMWMGGLLLVASDLLARWLSGPQELPIGIITALLGGVYLLRLLAQSKP